MIPFRKPNRIHEANVQARLFMELHNVGIKSYLEYKVKIEGARNGRLDLVILDDSESFILGIIECKSVSNRRYSERKESIMSSNQVNRYKTLGAPLKDCLGIIDIKDCVKWALNLVSEYKSKTTNNKGEE